jgi:hypothetical protein
MHRGLGRRMPPGDPAINAAITLRCSLLHIESAFAQAVFDA